MEHQALVDLLKATEAQNQLLRELLEKKDKEIHDLRGESGKVQGLGDDLMAKLDSIHETLRAGLRGTTVPDYSKTQMAQRLMAAVKRGRADLVEELLLRGAHIDGFGFFSKTSLCLAAEVGHLEVVKVLLKHGAVIDQRSEDTPLIWAIKGNHNRVVQCLIDSGADVNAKASSNSTPLKVAIDYKRHEIESLLRKHDAKID